MSIRIEKLSFCYRKNNKDILRDLNLVIEKGSIVLLLGLNGCGKTTLIKNLAGLLTPTEGCVFVNDKILTSMSIKERSEHIAYVSQKTTNLDDVIIKDYLSFGFTNKIKFYSKPNEKQITKVEEYAKKFNIMHLLDKSLDQISGGERQIVSLCCAMIQDTEIILLDEPTSALDLRNQNMVLSILSKLSIEEKKTIILSSHNPNHGLFLNCDVALMKDGKIEKFGPSNDVISVEALKSVYGNNICYSNELVYREVSFKKVNNCTGHDV